MESQPFANAGDPGQATPSRARLVIARLFISMLVAIVAAITVTAEPAELTMAVLGPQKESATLMEGWTPTSQAAVDGAASALI